MKAVLHVPAFEDNYIWLIEGHAPGAVAIVDPGEAGPVRERLARDGLKPVAILCTHHHGDHVGGIEELAREFHLPVYGPARENIASVTHPLNGGERIVPQGLGIEFEVLSVPGHTAGHIAYLGEGKLFCGDTLFSAGCGRLFEGTAEQMHDSLTRLAALPEATEVYCAHEYTEANLRFALAVEPENTDIQNYRETVRARRAQNLPTVPSTIGLERRINPFLRSSQASVRRAAEAVNRQPLAHPAQVFAALRRWKDQFRG